MAKRQSISAKARFEIFKRDKFTCQYCGRSSPDVILHIDHIQPVIEGGGNQPENLITSCADCNLGKGRRELSDDSAMKKRKVQLDELQERREQIQMMLEWQKGLENLDDYAIDAIDQLFQELVPGRALSDYGKKQIAREVKRFGMGEIMECLRISANQYLQYSNGRPTDESAVKVIDYTARIASNRKRVKENPYIGELQIIRSRLMHKFSYFNFHVGLSLLEKAYKAGWGVQDIGELCDECKSWSEFRDLMDVLSKGVPEFPEHLKGQIDEQ